MWPALRAYVALTKPNIIWLLLVTTVPAMVLAADAWPSTALVAATLIGGMLAAGGANAINQYLDRDIDALMRRTRQRPLPAGAVAPLQAARFGIVLSALAGGWLLLTVNWLAALLALGAIAFYVVVYTHWLKRSTWQNIVIGGAAGAAPALIGWAAVTGDLGSVVPFFMFVVVFWWTPPHFWALALVLEEDYRSAGVPMLPVVRSTDETRLQILVWSIAVAALTLLFAPVARLEWVYMATAFAGGAGFVGLAARLYCAPSTARAMRLFRYSTTYLGLLFVAMMVDVLLRA
ncbi:MAG: protoheme IX farnesyltransferase [Chloroflexi bacterium]|nr:protoheme IX farnesyltransferase [Chloroflexota bacterium]